MVFKRFWQLNSGEIEHVCCYFELDNVIQPEGLNRSCFGLKRFIFIS